MTARIQHTTQTDVTAINIDRGMAGDSVKPPVEQIKKYLGYTRTIMINFEKVTYLLFLY